MSRLIKLSNLQGNKKNNIEKLLTLNQHKIRLGLSRVKKVIQELKISNKPNTKYLTINGTSAKNSILQIFKSILIQHKKRYAATYSPHLLSIVERYEHNQKFIKPNILKKILIKVSKYKNLTQFEKLIVGFGIYIKKLNLDWCLVEFGLFGRLDAVRALISKPNIHIISPISWDHLNWTRTKKRNLKTLKEIVYEKTSFIRSNVYVAKQSPVVLKYIKSQLKKNNSNKKFYGLDFKIIKKQKKYFYKDKNYLFEIKSNLFGDYMYENMAVPIKIALDCKIPIKTIIKGLLKVNIQGRLQVLNNGNLLKKFGNNNKIVLDGAHNAQQSGRLVNVIKELKFKNRYAAISMINSKDPKSFLMPFKGKFKMIYFFDNPNQHNFIPKENLKKIAENLGIKSKIAYSFDEIRKDKNSLYLFTGSLYWIGYLLKKN